MGWGYGNIFGGAGLNFKVVGNPQPTSPNENTIWVNTDTAIDGYSIGTTAPMNPVEGAIWFNTSTTSNAAFNALKKNSLMVYPNSCQQYVSGAWVNKTAKIYQGGTWKDWNVVLFCDGVTTSGYSITSINSTNVNQNGYLGYSRSGQSGFAIEPAVNLSAYKTLEVEFEATMVINDGSGHIALGVGLNKTWQDQGGAQAVKYYKSVASKKTETISRMTAKLDISALAGNYYFLATGYASSYSGGGITLKIHSIKYLP